MADRTLARASRGSFFPSAWPTSTDTVMPMPIIGMKAIVFTLNARFVAASSLRPSLPTRRMNPVNPTMSMKNWMPLGSPKRISAQKAFRSGRQFSVLYRARRRPPKTRNEYETSCTHPAMTLAHPAPRIPISGNPA